MSDINILTAQGTATRPRGAVKLYDKEGIGNFITGWISWEVDNNAFRAADTFRVVFATAMLPPTNDANWFSMQQRMMVEIFATADWQGEGPYVPVPADSLLYGQVDAIDFDPVHGTVELTGRDLTALLIDTKVAKDFTNQKPGDIVRFVGNQIGLGVKNVQDAGKDFYGNVYKDGKVIYQTNEQAWWETLCDMANALDYVIYVKGQELFFQPRPGEQVDRYVLAWDAPNDDHEYPIANVVSLQFSRALTIAKGVSVEVYSWNAKVKKTFKETFPKAAKAVQPGQAVAKTQVYKYNFPGLMPDTAQQRAQSIYKQIIAHEMRLTAYLPADNVLDCTKTMMVRGTGTGFDQVYYPESVMRSMSLTEGYRMNIRAKNTSPELEVTQ